LPGKGNVGHFFCQGRAIAGARDGGAGRARACAHRSSGWRHLDWVGADVLAHPPPEPVRTMEVARGGRACPRDARKMRCDVSHPKILVLGRELENTK
jgi:hypothetical protein